MYSGDDQRKNPRYKVKSDVLAMLTPYPIKLGQIANISEGGVAFVYLGGEPISRQYTHLDLYATQGQKIFNGIPVKILGLVTVANLYDQSVSIRQVSMSFHNLTLRQKLHVREFISEYTL